VHRKTVEPLKEPIYVIRSDKNTFYESSDRNHFGLQTTFLIDFKLGDRCSFKLDELVRRTRQRGFTVEGFFQLFGKFSPNDGLRKLNLSQFIEALKAL